MAGAIFRVRSRLIKYRSSQGLTPEELAVLGRIATIVDEEIERDAEFEFTRPMNPDPVTAQTKEMKP